MQKKEGATMKKKVVKALIAIVVVVGLLLAAHMLINSFDIQEVIKQLHGG